MAGLFEFLASEAALEEPRDAHVSAAPLVSSLQHLKIEKVWLSNQETKSNNGYKHYL